MKIVSSPNFNDRAANVALDYIVLHYTGMKDAQAALTRMCDPAAQVSAHYMIDEDGSLIRLVEESKRAWHAGKSFWRGETDINSASIGIELVNPGHEFGYRPFPRAQIDALKPLLRDIIARHGLSAASCLIGHSDIAVGRRNDPGELFPWQELAQEGLGVWPQAKDEAPASENDMRTLLDTIGYDTTDIEASLRAFQRRYRPALLTGTIDSETRALLKALEIRLSAV